MRIPIDECANASDELCDSCSYCNLTKKDVLCSAFLAVFEVRQIYNAEPLTPAPAAQRELLCELSVWQRYRRFGIED